MAKLPDLPEELEKEIDEANAEDPGPVSDAPSDSGYETLAHGFLSPRHRRFAQLAAQGLSNKEIGAQLGYVDSRVSVLMRHPLIAAETRRLQDQVFAQTIEQRLKGMSETALGVIEQTLTDRSGRTKVGEKLTAAQYVIDRVDGKAVQKVDIGSSAIGSFLDRLDALKATGQGLAPARSLSSGPSDGIIDVTPEVPTATPRTEDDDLSDWVTEFDRK